MPVLLPLRLGLTPSSFAADAAVPVRVGLSDEPAIARFFAGFYDAILFLRWNTDIDVGDKLEASESALPVEETADDYTDLFEDETLVQDDSSDGLADIKDVPSVDDSVVLRIPVSASFPSALKDVSQGEDGEVSMDVTALDLDVSQAEVVDGPVPVPVTQVEVALVDMSSVDTCPALVEMVTENNGDEYDVGALKRSQSLNNIDLIVVTPVIGPMDFDLNWCSVDNGVSAGPHLRVTADVFVPGLFYGSGSGLNVNADAFRPQSTDLIHQAFRLQIQSLAHDAQDGSSELRVDAPAFVPRSESPSNGGLRKDAPAFYPRTTEVVVSAFQQRIQARARAL